MEFIAAVLYHARTMWLFTVRDIPTIMIPVTGFASMAGPLLDWRSGALLLTWLYLQLLVFDVVNQLDVEEDAKNKPWRPLPAGRLTVETARHLAYVLMIVAPTYSLVFGTTPVAASLMFIGWVVLYTAFKGDSNAWSKNICNAAGYVCLEAGTTFIAAGGYLDDLAFKALAISAGILLTTVHVQDFADVEGDELVGRKTFPIIAPELSRIVASVGVLAWSILIALAWELGPVAMVVYFAFASTVAVRCYRFRDKRSDDKNYLLYNLWLLTSHLLPGNARWHMLCW